MREVLTSHHTPEQLERDRIFRAALEEAARTIDNLSGNDLYIKAWKKAAKAVRELKDLTRS